MKKTILVILAGMLHLFTIPCLAQEDEPLRYIQNRLTAYRDKTLQEKLFVHTDKTTYLTGEFLWFKVYYVEGFTHQPLALSRVAYAELLNASNQPVAQAKVSLKAGEENGSLYLPLNLPTGNYKFRAYTAWMKNFGPEFFFEKQVSIINPLSNAKTQIKTPVENGNNIDFFPEGGDLVSGVTSTLGFKATDAYGKGVNFKGWIANEKGDTVTAFSPLRFGMGRTSFTPTVGQRYIAIVLFDNGQQLKKALPEAQANGYAMHLENTGSSQIKLEVKTNRVIANEPVFLVAHTRGVVRVAKGAVLNNGEAVFRVERGDLLPGITHFTVFDRTNRPVAERLCFTPPQPRGRAEARTDKKEYASREKIMLSVRTLDEKGAQVPANLSLSVFRADAVQTPDGSNIENYLLLTSDLTGRVDSADYYFDERSPEREQAMDNLMLTQGWRRFRWQNVLNEKQAFAAAYPPEINGPLLTGRVYDAATGQLVSGLQTFVALPGKQHRVYFSQSNSAGQVQFELKDKYGPGEMIVRPFSADDSLYRIELQNLFSEQHTQTLLAPLVLQKEQEKLLANYSIGMQVRQVYTGDSLNRFNEPVPADSASFLGKPDYRYNLDDYTRFTTMEEVLREYVRPITVGVKNGQPHMNFLNEVTRTTHDQNVLVMIDGVPLYNHDRVFSYDPLKVKRLDVFPRPYVMGSNYFFGVASFSTYKGNFDAFDLDPHLIALDYQGLQMQREFYAPSYETPAQKESRLPDYRSTLYWIPQIRTGSTGSNSLAFFSCDQKGSYTGLLQGIGSDGQTFVQMFSFEVK